MGFMPAGNYLGQVIAGLSYPWIIVPISMLIGYFIVKAEPAVYVLTEQVEELTSGAISAKAMGMSLSTGPMTATFLLPFSMGACEALGGNVVTDAFGVVAMVAMTPLITIQILGLIYQIQEEMKEKQAAKDYTSIKVCIENLDNVDNQEIIEL